MVRSDEIRTSQIKPDKIKSEHAVLEQYVVSLAHQFTSGVDKLQKTETQASEPLEKPLQENKPISIKRNRRKRGTEFTLDD